MWWPASAALTLSWGKSTVDLFRHTRKAHHPPVGELSTKTLGAGAYADVRAGRNWRAHRRSDRGDRAASGHHVPASQRSHRVLLDDAQKAARKVSRAGVHQHFLHAAR